MVKTQIDAAGELQRAAELLFKNWALAIPTAVVSLAISITFFVVVASAVATVFAGGLAGGHLGAGLAALFAAAPLLLIFIAASAVLFVLAQAVVVRAAEDVWEGRPLDLSVSLAAVTGRIVPLVGALVLSILVLLIPIALSAFLIGIPLVLIGAYFLMYVIPAVVLGGESASGALSASFAIAKENVGPSIIAFVGILVAGIVGSVANSIFSHVPLLNFLVAFAVGGLTSAYTALVASRFYTLLRPGAPPAPVMPS
jgi:hypothetical protein